MLLHAFNSQLERERERAHLAMCLLHKCEVLSSDPHNSCQRRGMVLCTGEADWGGGGVLSGALSTASLAELGSSRFNERPWLRN